MQQNTFKSCLEVCRNNLSKEKRTPRSLTLPCEKYEATEIYDTTFDQRSKSVLAYNHCIMFDRFFKILMTAQHWMTCHKRLGKTIAFSARLGQNFRKVELDNTINVIQH